MLKVPEKNRFKVGAFASSKADGNNGVFIIPIENNYYFQVIVSDGLGWEHVSVCVIHAMNESKGRIPTWNEMCKIKQLFWDKEDTVIQYHPAESEYVNNHPNVLHLWRPVDQQIPTPPAELIGIK
jgi:hypothetical protein